MVDRSVIEAYLQSLDETDTIVDDGRRGARREDSGPRLARHERPPLDARPPGGGRSAGPESGAPSAAKYLAAGQPEGFRQSWLGQPLGMDLSAFGIAGELVPANEWAGDVSGPVVQLDGRFSDADFSLFLSQDCAFYLLSRLPEAVTLERADPRDLALVFEHVLTPLLDGLEKWTNRTLSFRAGRLVESEAVHIDALARIDGDAGALPLGLGARDEGFWRSLTVLNDFRLANAAQQPVRVSLAVVTLGADEVAGLAEGDVIILEEARSATLAGDLLIDDAPAFNVSIAPGTATVLDRVETAPPPPERGEVAIRFILATLPMTIRDIAGLRPGGEMTHDDLQNGAVEILCNGHSSGQGHIIQEGDAIGIKIDWITWHAQSDG